MNKADKAIKLLMLALPHQYPTRWSVLLHMFLSAPASHRWDDKGNLFDTTKHANPAYKAAKKGEMSYQDLDIRARILAASSETTEHGMAYKEKSLVLLGEERAIREYRAKNFDPFVKYHLQDPCEGALDELAQLADSWKHTAMAQVSFFDDLHEDWALALLETACVVDARLVHHLNLSKSKVRLADVPIQWRALYKLTRKVRQAL